MRPQVIAWPVVPRRRPGERWKALRERLVPRLPGDARVFQVLFLASLLSLGVLARDFTLRPEQMALTFMAALATQAIFMQALGLRHRGVLSAAVTARAVECDRGDGGVVDDEVLAAIDPEDGEFVVVAA